MKKKTNIFILGNITQYCTLEKCIVGDIKFYDILMINARPPDIPSAKKVANSWLMGDKKETLVLRQCLKIIFKVYMNYT